MIRMYAHPTCEISLLSGDDLPIRQPPQTVPSLRQNVARPPEAIGAQTETVVVPHPRAGTCAVRQDRRLGRNTASWRVNRFRAASGSHAAASRQATEDSARPVCARGRRLLLQVQAHGLGDVRLGAEAGTIPPGILP